MKGIMLSHPAASVGGVTALVPAPAPAPGPLPPSERVPVEPHRLSALDELVRLHEVEPEVGVGPRLRQLPAASHRVGLRDRILNDSGVAAGSSRGS
jgi:hypothetical protein